MSLRDYDGWRRYAKHKREAREAYERGLKKQQMSDREIMEGKKGMYPHRNTIHRYPNPIPVKNITQMPDQKWHRIVSFIKSGIRILGYCFIPFNLVTAVILLIASEIVGIFEELV